jgi:predicted kinase
VIADAVFARAGDRAAIEQTARAAVVPFVGLWLEAPEARLVARVEQRQRDASDADATIVHQQRAQNTGTIGWHRIDASGDIDGVVRTASMVVRQLLPSNAVSSIAGRT